MKLTGSASFQVNDISMTWDESPKRVEKACVKCGKLTRGRVVNGGGIKKAAHLSCAMVLTTDRALHVYSK